MRRLLITNLLALSGCGLEGIANYGLTLDGLIVETPSGLRSCPFEQPPFVGAADYAPNPLCEEVRSGPFPNTWRAGDHSYVFRSYAPLLCPTKNCGDLISVDLETGGFETITGGTPRGYVRTAGEWVVWVDLRHDQNGLCRFPAGDEDCAADLYGFNLRTRTEHRLTPSSTVYPPEGDVGRDAFGLDGTHVVYADARDPSCGVLGIHNESHNLCRSTLRAIDLATLVDRELRSAETSAIRVRMGIGAIVWLESKNSETFELMYLDLANNAEPIALGEVPYTLNYEVDREWVVYETRDDDHPIIEAIHPHTKEVRRLTGEDEYGAGPEVKNGRAIWIDKDRQLLSVYDFATGVRSVAVEVP